MAKRRTNHVALEALSEDVLGAEVRKRGKPAVKRMDLHTAAQSPRKAESFGRDPLHTMRSWFDKYSGGCDVFGVDGVLAFCEDISLCPEDEVLLLLAYHCQCGKVGRFTWDEFSRGLSTLRCYDLSMLVLQIPSLRSTLSDRETFREVSRFAFDFARSAQPSQRPASSSSPQLPLAYARRSLIGSLHSGHSDHQRIAVAGRGRRLEKKSAIQMLYVLLQKRWPLFHDFIMFYRAHSSLVMTRDQWCGIMDFACYVGDDISSYSDEEACMSPQPLHLFSAQLCCCGTSLGMLTFVHRSSGNILELSSSFFVSPPSNPIDFFFLVLLNSLRDLNRSW